MLGSDINACEHVLIKMVYGTVLLQQQTKTKQALLCALMSYLMLR